MTQAFVANGEVSDAERRESIELRQKVTAKIKFGEHIC